MTRKLWLLSVVLLAALLAAGTSPAAAQEKSYQADRFDVTVVAEPGGSLLVTETAVYHFSGGPFTFIFRELTTDHTDGVTVLETSVDGRTYPAGDQAGQVEISGRSPIRVTWHLEPTVDATRTVVLTYRVAGVVRQTAAGDELRWQPLPDDYDFRIARSETLIRWPSGLRPVAGPDVLAGETAVDVAGNAASFTANNLAPDTPLVVSLTFPAGSLIAAPPAWQAQDDAQNAQAPYWLAAGGAILLAGIAFVVATVRRSSPPAVKDKGLAYEPPAKLAPGLAGTLLAPNAGASWATALGTLFDLAEQGVLEIDESPEKKWYRQHDFLIRLLERPRDLLPHQAALLDLLFTTRKGPVKTVKFSEMQQVVTSGRWKTYTQAVEAELKAAHLFSEARRQTRRMLLAGGITLVLLGLASMIAVALLPIGPAGLAVSLGVAGIGIAALIGAATLTPLTDAAAAEAAAWQRFANYLKQVSRGRESVPGPQTFVKYLPFAATFGILPQWARHFEKAGWVELPPYFRALPTSSPADSMAAFVAMSAASSSAGGAAAGGAAAAGAAGGGAAGAG